MPWVDFIWTYLAAAGAAIWLGILLAPWQSWRTRERLEVTRGNENADLGNVTVLIPARNEADVIGDVVAALGRQGRGLSIILVDDRSEDGTAEAARRGVSENCDLEIVSGEELPTGWVGKMWALEQGRERLTRPLVLLLDGDIVLAPGTLSALLDAKREKGVVFLSLMAALDMRGFWQALLMPAFVYFFKLLYPFYLSNGGGRLVAAAAGGCILIERDTLADIGGFATIRGAIIDDCTLARAVKRQGGRTWIGLTRAVTSLRPYDELGAIWRMVVRSAFTQLHHSLLLLLLCTLVFALACALPSVILVAIPVLGAKLIAIAALIFMVVSYLPTLRYYGMHPGLALTMPLIGMLYLAMTWNSAHDYWRGRRSLWKGRVYSRDLKKVES